MKKIKLLSLTILPLLTVPVSLASCHKNNSHFIDIPEKDKQVEAEEGLEAAIYEIPLANKIESTHSLSATATTTSTSTEGLSIAIPHIAVSAEDDKWIWFVARMDGIPSNDKLWAKFDITITCKNMEGDVVWNETIKGFKLTVEHDPEPTVETHSVTSKSSVKCITTSLDKTSFGADDSVVLTLNNTGRVFANEVSLTYNVGTQTFSEKIDNISVGANTYTLSKEIINQKLAAHSLSEMGKQDSISVVAVIIGSYEVDSNNHIYKYDAQGELQQLTNDDFESLKNKYLYKDSLNMFVLEEQKTLHDFIDAVPAGSTADIYLIYGSDYQIKSGGTTEATININGILSYQGEKLATIKAHYDDSSSKLDWQNHTFTFIDLIVDCEKTCGTSFYVNGIRCNEFNATRCRFEGTYTQYCYGKFKDCIFDSSMIKNSEKTDSEYGIFYYGTDQPKPLEFEDCTFKNCGKAFKAYSEQTSTKNDDIKFTDCTFTLVEEHVTDVKSPINNNEAAKVANNVYYNIYSTNNKMIGYPESKQFLTSSNGRSVIVDPE